MTFGYIVHDSFFILLQILNFSGVCQLLNCREAIMGIRHQYLQSGRIRRRRINNQYKQCFCIATHITEKLFHVWIEKEKDIPHWVLLPDNILCLKVVRFLFAFDASVPLVWTSLERSLCTQEQSLSFHTIPVIGCFKCCLGWSLTLPFYGYNCYFTLFCPCSSC